MFENVVALIRKEFKYLSRKAIFLGMLSQCSNIQIPL